MSENQKPGSNTDLVHRYEESRRRLPIVRTTRTPSGQIIDWVPVQSQDPGEKIATPPPPLPPPTRETAPLVEDHHSTAIFELSDHAVERGPAGTVPLLRRDVSRVTAAGRRFQSRKRKVDGRRLVPHPSRPPFADPDPLGYYHATTAETTTCYGCQS